MSSVPPPQPLAESPSCCPAEPPNTAIISLRRPSPSKLSTQQLLQISAGFVAFLTVSDIAALQACDPVFTHVDTFGALPLPGTLQPVLNRKHRAGFGQPTPATRSVTNDKVPFFLIIHHAWEWLLPSSRHAVALADPTTSIQQYNTLRHKIPQFYLNTLRLPRTREPLASMDVHTRSELLGAAFITVNCCVGDLLRCLGPEFSNDLRNVDQELQCIDDLHLPDPPPNYPPVDLPMAKSILREGVPLQGHFECPLRSTQRRLLYNNHPPLKEVEVEVREKFFKEEKKCYHLLLPRFLAWFVFGLFISPISWVQKRNKGRIVIDSSTQLGPDDAGAPNSFIPPPSSANYRENPPVHYQSAWTRLLVHIFTLRTNWPLEEILLHIDDIEAAFRRALYHPDLAAVFASVFMEFFVIPVGMIFGSRSSPSYYCILGELRAHVASVANLDHIPVPKEWIVSLPPDLSEVERSDLASAGSDPLYILDDLLADRSLIQAMFVDDTAKAELYHRILQSVRNSVAAAFLVFGFPEDDWRGACFAIDKWLSAASHEVSYLGFSINSRTMTVSWPVEKRLALAELIRNTLPASSSDRRKRKPVEFAIILGHLRNPAALAPALAYISLRIQLWFNGEVRTNKAHVGKSAWWRNPRLQVPAFVWHDLRLLLEVVDSNDPLDPFWRRSIGMLIPRTTSHFAYQDASYEGLGGFSEEFGFAWRLHRSELEALGIPMPLSQEALDLPIPEDCSVFVDSDLFVEVSGDDAVADPTHINVLEFVAAIINYWFVLARAAHLPEPDGGWVIGILGQDHSGSYRGQEEYDCRRSLPMVDSSNVGFRYTAALGPSTIPGLSSSAAAIISDFHSHVTQQSRGETRDSNDGTFDSRCRFFAAWLSRHCTENDVQLFLQHGSFPQIIGAYLEYVRSSGGIKRLTTIQADTLAGYATAAEKYVQAMFDRSFHLRGLDGKSFVPVVGDIIANHRSWVPSTRARKEPFTLPMFRGLFRHVNELGDPLCLEAAVFDWAVLGISTGSRISEYGQNRASKLYGFSAVPAPSPDQGMPIAFTRADFTFYNSRGIRQSPSSHDVTGFDDWTAFVRFRYDKGPHNYVTKKYRAIPKCALCPVARILSILQRADAMGIPATFPVGAFWDYQASSFSFITGSHVANIMKQACIMAYPDPQHYMRLHIDGIVAHSCRVTAAVALRAAGMDIPTIASRLRWSPESVETYLRECYQDIGALTHSAVRGAFMISQEDPSVAPS